MKDAQGKWTPGPWRAMPFSSVVGCPISAKSTSNIIAFTTHHASRENTEANARLIAAAPAMAEQLRLAVQHIDLLQDTLNDLIELYGATVSICGAEYKDAHARAALKAAGIDPNCGQTASELRTDEPTG